MIDFIMRLFGYENIDRIHIYDDFENKPPNKVKKAKRLLLESNLSIKEISFILGFENEGSFILFFKKHCSTTPGSFRKNVQ